ncbi:lipopolysaccharide-induced tumor necrosis factor-alpha factor homolog [Drosophila sulfurigaster albostrigata]|uniref:Lipopolysaccharide-induced tumor necrosis factor-alpha factor homolog n=1 Tax=Drosophila albomicans TaxID=7291 RepID=A0A6P8XFU4_DROAB|nr:lipopolysaccharide-induced tumor necrosis factor-alpha factor homolog [Drosophila albomicans]XP_060656779.1 lipopolysaccharide-induced tumor necrosis factor-alpha factor homolog [Drosophila nasuta]XP_062133488.1 lipopolysaccharide-induced tumor necrosis factor-alpha factor homolog [Drosophila sulfurigaster albostrigata]
MNVGPESTRLVCPNCQMEVMTKATAITTTKTHLIAILMCLFCCWICAPVVYCTDCARSIEHTCPSCNNYIGTYDR